MKLKLSLPRGDDDDIDLTPMIDCVFQLILFFMLTSSFIEEAKGFEVALPRAAQATTIAREKIDSITVTADGRYSYRSGTGKDRPVKDLDELLTELRQEPGRDQRAVIIRCDAKCEYQQFVRVKNVLKLAGVQTVFEEVEVRP